MTITDPNLERWVDEAVRRQLDVRLQEVFELAADELCHRAQQFSDVNLVPVAEPRTSWISEVGEATAAPLGLGLRSLVYAIAEAFGGMAAAVDPADREVVEVAPVASELDLPSTLGELRKSSLSTHEAADRLGVNPSRIRQRLLERTLYGFKDGTSWWVPEFQFEDDGTVPGVGQVFPEIQPSVSPLTVARWFVIPWEDLVVDEDRELVVSPRTWLLEGRDPEPVAQQARVL